MEKSYKFDAILANFLFNNFYLRFQFSEVDQFDKKRIILCV